MLRLVLEVCKRQGLSRILVLSGFYRSWALIQRGDAEQGIMVLLGGRPPALGIADRVDKWAGVGYSCYRGMIRRGWDELPVPWVGSCVHPLDAVFLARTLAAG
jgi:hypothetical protein